MLVFAIAVVVGISFLIRVFVAFWLETRLSKRSAVAKIISKDIESLTRFTPPAESSRFPSFDARLRNAAMAVNEADEHAELHPLDRWARRSGF